MILMPIASSSSGNCTLLKSEHTNFLIDCGISGKSLAYSLQILNINPQSISAIFVTHEHIDHIKGVGIISRKYNVPIYANNRTWSGMEPLLGKLAPENKKFFETGESFLVDNISVRPFSIPHDASEPVGFNFFDTYGAKHTVATDLGHIDDALIENIIGSESVLIESNHDIGMLKNGSYPYMLKQRVLGEFGHLSNVSAATLAYKLASSGTKRIILAHLSQENNTAQIAYQTVCDFLQDNGLIVGRDISLDVAKKVI